MSASNSVLVVFCTTSTTTAVHARIPDVGSTLRWSSRAFIRLDLPAPVSPTTAITVLGNTSRFSTSAKSNLKYQTMKSWNTHSYDYEHLSWAILFPGHIDVTTWNCYISEGTVIIEFVAQLNNKVKCNRNICNYHTCPFNFESHKFKYPQKSSFVVFYKDQFIRSPLFLKLLTTKAF